MRLDPPITALADRFTAATQGCGLMVRTAEADELPWLPVMVACTVAVTGLVVTVKLAEVCPAGTVVEAGTWALELLLCRFTTRPPEGAGSLNVTVPVEGLPPVTGFGDKLSDITFGVDGFVDGLMVRTAEAEEPGMLPVMVACTVVVTGLVVTVKVAEVCPAATVVEAGT